MSSVPLLICAGLAILAVTVSGTPTSQEQEMRKSYAGYKLLRTLPIEEAKKVEALLLSLDGKQGVHFWKYPKLNESSDILASPRLEKHVRGLLTELGLEHDVLIHDIDEILKGENPTEIPQEIEGRQVGSKPRLNFNSYFRYNDIVAFCQFLSEKSRTNGGPQVTVESIGKSTEGRDIILVKLSNGDGAAKPAIWVDGGMHAREWISPATVTYILNTLVTDSAKSADLLKQFDWYIVPVINVDGYEYTHTNDRFWRKTRSRTSSYLGCRGTDPNRNWAFQWGGEGTSSDPCSDIYKGPRAFSEPETQAVANAILARKSQIKMYLTFHSYSQILLVPWGFGRQKPADYRELYNLALKGKTALEQTFGTQYKLGTAPDILYAAAGGSDDWAKGAAGIKYSYTFELRDTGRYGFALPAAQIQPVGEETFNAVKALAFGLNQALNLKDGTNSPAVPVPAPGAKPQTPPKMPQRQPVRLPNYPPWRPHLGDEGELDNYVEERINEAKPALVLHQ